MSALGRPALMLLILAAFLTLWLWSSQAPSGQEAFGPVALSQAALSEAGSDTASTDGAVNAGNTAPAEAVPGFSSSDDPNAPSFTKEPDWGSGDESLEPVPIAEAGDVYLSVYSDVGYHDAQGRYVVDLLEQDYAYLVLMVATAEGRPVVGAEPRFEAKGTSQLLTPEMVLTRSTTDASGTLDFAVIGGAMGLDSVTVSLGESQTELLVNVISLRSAGFPALPEVEGGPSWRELMGAEVRFGEEGMIVEFPEAISQLSDQTVRLSGFMMPLDADLRQRHFLLTSNPPSCFFHIPGGPAGAVEVLMKKGVEASWDPLVVEGRFKTLASAEFGIIYQLRDARVVEP